MRQIDVFFSSGRVGIMDELQSFSCHRDMLIFEKLRCYFLIVWNRGKGLSELSV